MRIVIQRVKRASVTIEGKIHSSIGKGLLVLTGIEEADTTDDVEWLAAKAVNLRVFDDSNGVMNLSAIDTASELMIVSQFTLHASTRKGNRPSYIRAARPEKAVPLYEEFIMRIGEFLGRKPKTGIFGAMMEIELVNDGPVTIIIDSKQRE
ncbi:MAG: D-aminoacyl-tRNA deacylase [Bacteroidales bacterium]|nr:D-aminoacyl-tRNA deacylase [Bacteroidales bacterium]MDT8373676.1 D-aminoacyl-tRNA deacylase [Bacteroidales bacterium]